MIVALAVAAVASLAAVAAVLYRRHRANRREREEAAAKAAATGSGGGPDGGDDSLPDGGASDSYLGKGASKGSLAVEGAGRSEPEVGVELLAMSCSLGSSASQFGSVGVSHAGELGPIQTRGSAVSTVLTTAGTGTGGGPGSVPGSARYLPRYSSGIARTSNDGSAAAYGAQWGGLLPPPPPLVPHHSAPEGGHAALQQLAMAHPQGDSVAIVRAHGPLHGQGSSRQHNLPPGLPLPPPQPSPRVKQHQQHQFHQYKQQQELGPLPSAFGHPVVFSGGAGGGALTGGFDGMNVFRDAAGGICLSTSSSAAPTGVGVAAGLGLGAGGVHGSGAFATPTALHASGSGQLFHKHDSDAASLQQQGSARMRRDPSEVDFGRPGAAPAHTPRAFAYSPRAPMLSPRGGKGSGPLVTPMPVAPPVVAKEVTLLDLFNASPLAGAALATPPTSTGGAPPPAQPRRLGQDPLSGTPADESAPGRRPSFAPGENVALERLSVQLAANIARLRRMQEETGEEGSGAQEGDGAGRGLARLSAPLAVVGSGFSLARLQRLGPLGSPREGGSFTAGRMAGLGNVGGAGAGAGVASSRAKSISSFPYYMGGQHLPSHPSLSPRGEGTRGHGVGCGGRAQAGLGAARGVSAGSGTDRTLGSTVGSVPGTTVTGAASTSTWTSSLAPGRGSAGSAALTPCSEGALSPECSIGDKQQRQQQGATGEGASGAGPGPAAAGPAPAAAPPADLDLDISPKDLKIHTDGLLVGAITSPSHATCCQPLELCLSAEVFPRCRAGTGYTMSSSCCCFTVSSCLHLIGHTVRRVLARSAACTAAPTRGSRWPSRCCTTCTWRWGDRRGSR